MLFRWLLMKLSRVCEVMDYEDDGPYSIPTFFEVVVMVELLSGKRRIGSA